MKTPASVVAVVGNVLLNTFFDELTGNTINETILMLTSPTFQSVKIFDVNLSVRSGDRVRLHFGTRPFEKDPTLVRIDTLDINDNSLHITTLSSQAYRDALNELGIDENKIITYF